MFDNIKAILLLCVALGHACIPFLYNDMDTGREYNVLFKSIIVYVYLFHMPLFAFISGYFSGGEKCKKDGFEKHNLISTLIPYIIFQSLYILVGLFAYKLGIITDISSFTLSLLVASGPLYYLFALFLWRLTLASLLKIRFIIPIMFLIGLIIPYDSKAGIMILPIFFLWPFFLLGSIFKQEWLNQIKRVNIVFAITCLICCLFLVRFLPYEMILFRDNYSSTFMNAGYKILHYVLAIIISCAVIRLSSQKKMFFSYVGKNSIIPYIVCSFIIPYGYLIIFNKFIILKNNFINLMSIIVFCSVIILISGMDIFMRMYMFMIKKIEKMLLK